MCWTGWTIGQECSVGNSWHFWKWLAQFPTYWMHSVVFWTTSLQPFNFSFQLFWWTLSAFAPGPLWNWAGLWLPTVLSTSQCQPWLWVGALASSTSELRLGSLEEILSSFAPGLLWIAGITKTSNFSMSTMTFQCSAPSRPLTFHLNCPRTDELDHECFCSPSSSFMNMFSTCALNNDFHIWEILSAFAPGLP